MGPLDIGRNYLPSRYADILYYLQTKNIRLQPEKKIQTAAIRQINSKGFGEAAYGPKTIEFRRALNRLFKNGEIKFRTPQRKAAFLTPFTDLIWQD